MNRRPEISGSILVDFQAVRPDGCVSLELNETIADLKAKGLDLHDGQSLDVWQPWRDKRYEATGVVRWDEHWGWGVEIDPRVLAGFQSDDSD